MAVYYTSQFHTNHRGKNKTKKEGKRMRGTKNKRLLFMVSVGVMLISVFAVAITSTSAIAQKGISPRVLERIQTDREARRITVDEYILYKTWAVFDPQKLVGTRYALSAEETKLLRKCGTPIILEIREIWNKLSPKTKAQLKWVFLRPTDPGGGTDGNQHLLPQLYGTEHFLIHWTNGADGGLAEDAPPLTDSDADGTPDYIENLGAIFEYVWNFEISNRGFDMPPNDADLPSNDENNRNPDDRYDIFVYDMNPYGYAKPEYLVNETPENDKTSFIAVENDYIGFSGTQLECMQVTAAHEFHHAIQFGYDYEEKGWWMETTSVYMEDEVYPDINDNYQYLYNWFQY